MRLASDLFSASLRVSPSCLSFFWYLLSPSFFSFLCSLWSFGDIPLNFPVVQTIGLYPFCFFCVCFLLHFWAEHCFKEAFLLVTSAHFGRICSHFCSLKCANYSYFCFARSISARFVVSARYVLQIPPFLLCVQRLWPWFSQRLQLHGSCAGCLGAIVHIYTRHTYIYCFLLVV